jgi:hypothetical protein
MATELTVIETHIKDGKQEGEKERRARWKGWLWISNVGAVSLPWMRLRS